MKNNIEELQDEIYKLKEINRILLFQKDYLEQQLTESETAREHRKLWMQRLFGNVMNIYVTAVRSKKKARF